MKALLGPWDFYWQKTPENLQDSVIPDFQVPMNRYWNDSFKPLPKRYPSEGYATYRLVLRGLSPRQEGYTISFLHTCSSMNASIFPKGHPERASNWNSGRPGINKEETQPSRIWGNIHFEPKAMSEEWVLLVHVANFHHHFGGARYTPLMSRGMKVVEDGYIQSVGNLLTIGIMFAIGFYSLAAYLRRRESAENLFLCLASMTLALRTFVLDPLVHRYVFGDSYFMFSVQWKAEYITIAATVFFVEFLDKSFPGFLKEFVVKWNRRAIVLYLLFILLSPVDIFTRSVFVLYAIGLVQLSLYSYVLVQSVRAKREGFEFGVLGIFCLVSGFVYDMLVGAAVIPPPYMSHYSFSLFLFIESQIVAKKSAKAFQNAAMMAEDLKLKNQEISAHSQELERQQKEIAALNKNLQVSNQLLEESLREIRYEVSSRVVMVRELAHRGNNPLHAAQLAMDNIKEEIRKNSELVFSLFEEASKQSEVERHYYHQLSLMYEKLFQDHGILQSQLQLTAQVIRDMRVLSGVDGRSFEILSFKEAADRAKERLALYVSDTSRLKLQVGENFEMFTDPLVFELNLERIMRLFLGLSQGEVIASVKVSRGQEGFTWNWNFESQSVLLKNEDLQVIEDIGHTLKSCGVSLSFDKNAWTFAFAKVASKN